MNRIMIFLTIRNLVIYKEVLSTDKIEMFNAKCTSF